MCVYCNLGDTWWKYDPPWKRDDLPYVPPSVPFPVQPLPQTWEPWSLEKLKEYHKLLKEVREMEDKLGCPCEPNKADYVKLLEERIKELEKRLGR